MNRYEALRHAVKAHAGAVDKCGQPYILHPIAVAEAIEQGPRLGMKLNTSQIEALIPVALLHDVLEDTDYPLPLIALDRTGRDALQAVTKLENETYADYIERICGFTAACIVKLADLWHNLQPERQDCLPDKERASLEARYLDARQRIWDALGYSWWPSTEDK